VLEFIAYCDANPAKYQGNAVKRTTDSGVIDAYWLKAKALNNPAPATTKRENPVMGCDSLNPLESLGEKSEAVSPLV
jgi:hypothetical protein